LPLEDQGQRVADLQVVFHDQDARGRLLRNHHNGASRAKEVPHPTFPTRRVLPAYGRAPSCLRLSARRANSAFCGSANFLMPSSRRESSRWRRSPSRSIAASTSAGGRRSIWRVKVRPPACTRSLVAGGLVSMSEPAKASTYFHGGSSGFLV